MKIMLSGRKEWGKKSRVSVNVVKECDMKFIAMYDKHSNYKKELNVSLKESLKSFNYVCMCVCMHLSVGALGGSHPLLGTELCSFARVVYILNY